MIYIQAPSLLLRLLRLPCHESLDNPSRESCQCVLNAPKPQIPKKVNARARYRAILYERNYYDIFFLDREGNCIYSVYKDSWAEVERFMASVLGLRAWSLRLIAFGFRAGV